MGETAIVAVMSRAARLAWLFAFAFGASAAEAAELNLLCSVPVAWCDSIAAAFEKDTGAKVAVTQKAAAEVIGLLTAQKAGPRFDVWYGGAGDLHIQAGELGFTDEFHAAEPQALRDWAHDFAAQSGHRSVALYQRPIGLIVNTRRLAQKKLDEPRCWADLAKPEYDDQLQMGHPLQSATSRATMIALVNLFGEARAFEILKRIHANVAGYSRRATDAGRATARGDATMAVVYFYEGANEVAGGFPVKLIAPCEGLPYDVLAASLMKDARNADTARKFLAWSLTPAALDLQYAQNFWQMPANRNSRLPKNVWNTDDAKVVPNDYARYPLADRRRLYRAWDQEVGTLPR